MIGKSLVSDILAKMHWDLLMVSLTHFSKIFSFISAKIMNCHERS